MKPIKLVRGFFTVGAWTMASRILGFVRDAWIAAALGTGPTAQAFIIAFSLPNMFRRFFAEGALNTAFVPMFSKKLEANKDVDEFASEVASGLVSILILFTLLAQAIMPFLILSMASGFRDDARFDLTIHYSRITFIYILFISLAAILSGILNATGRFATAAAAPTLLNLTFMATLWCAPIYGWELGEALAWSTPVAGVAQMLLLWFAVKRTGIKIRFKLPRLTPDMKRLAAIAAPAMLAGGVVQINIIISRQIASYFDQAVAWLYNADRLYQLPLGVVAVAIGVVLLPDLSRKLTSKDEIGAQNSLNRAAEFALALTLPASVAFVIVAEPLVTVLFERGKFNVHDTAATAVALSIYGLGLPAFVLQKVLQPVFFARGDTELPFYYATISMFLNCIFAIILLPIVGYLAAAIATSAAAWAMVFQLWFGSRNLGVSTKIDKRFRSRIPRIIAASLFMGGVLYLVNYMISPMFNIRWLRFLGLLILILSGAISYFGGGFLAGAFKISDFKDAVKRS